MKRVSIFVFLVCLMGIGYYGYTSYENKTEKLVTDSTVSTLILEFPLPETIEPYGKHAHAPDAPSSAWFYKNFTVPEDMVVTKITPIVENAPQEIIHHLALQSEGKDSVICGQSTHKDFREYYTISRNNISEATVFPSGYGVYLNKDETLNLEVMTHVLEQPYGPGSSFDNVVVKLAIEYVPRNTQTVMKPLVFVRIRMDDTPCAQPYQHQAFVVPAGTGEFVRQASSTPQIEESESYTFNSAGTIFTRGANFWTTKGGLALKTYFNAEPWETFTAETGPEPWQSRILEKTEPKTVDVGDKLTFEVVYNKNPDDEIKDASGILGFYFAPQL